MGLAVVCTEPNTGKIIKDYLEVAGKSRRKRVIIRQVVLCAA